MSAGPVAAGPHAKGPAPRARPDAARAAAAPTAADASGGVLRCACGGGCPACPPRPSGGALPVTAPGDPLERQADQLADALVRPGPGPAGLPPEPLPAVSLPATLPRGVARAIAGPARPLDAGVRGELEPRLGRDLSAVRVHAGDEAARAARGLDARAVAVGRHLLFGAGEYAPGRPGGRRLLAHELAHVVQQGVGGFAALARQVPASGVTPHTEVPLRDGVVLRSGHGWATVVVLATEHAPEVQWATFEWDPQHDARPDIQVVAEQTNGGRAYGLRVTSTVEIHATVDRSLEDRRSSSEYTLFSYDLNFPGQVTTGNRSLPAPWRHRELYAPRYNPELPSLLPLGPPSIDAMDPLRDAAPPSAPSDARQEEQREERRQELIRGHPAFETREAMEEYIRAHPDQSFIGITTSYGRFVARRVDERELQRLADTARRDAAGLAEVAWDAERRTSAWGVTAVYHGGATLDGAALANLFFAEAFDAGLGYEGQVREAEVFRVGENSFGRRPLTHDQALARWRELDAFTGDQVAALQSEPGRRFEALWVRGPGGMHEIDARYFYGRDLFRAQMGTLGQERGNLAALLAGSSGADVRRFLSAETDREVEDPSFRTALAARPVLAEAVGDFIYQQVEDRAQELALRAITDARNTLAPLATDAERMRAFVLGFADLPADRRAEALDFLGVPDRDRAFVQTVLSDRDRAARVALGLTEEQTDRRWTRDPGGGGGWEYDFYFVSVNGLQGWAAETLTGLDQAADQLRSRSVRALRLQGPLGDRVRRQAYRGMGFLTLDPAGYPHAAEAPGWRPEPLAAGPQHFTTIGEQLYANHASRLSDEEFVWDVLRVTAKVVLAIVAVMAAQAAGAAAAGLLFAEGSAAFIATELVVSGAVFTALNEAGTYALEGRTESESVLGFVGHSLLNAATFGVFRALNTVLAAGARSFVVGRVGEAGFRASRGAQAFAEGLRITGVGASFIGLALGQRLAAGQGLPRGRELALFVYENLLNLALLEGAAVMARPFMEQTGVWARSQRLGALEPELTALRGDLARLQRDVAGIAVRPQSAARDTAGLIARQEALLQRQRALAEQLREHFRTRGDARALEAQAGREIELIDTALQGLAQAQFLVAEQVMPVEGSESVFTYRAGEGSLERFRSFYGAERVRVEPDGTVRVEVPGLATRELVFVPAPTGAAGTGPAGPGAAPAVPPLVQRQLQLQARQQALLERAERLGVSHPSLEAIRGLRPAQQTVTSTLDATESLIATAETQVGTRFRTIERNVLRNLTRRLGAGAVAEIRSGQLSGATNAVADVLWFARGLQGFGIPQIRALLFAYRSGTAVDIPRLLRTARGFSVQQRNFVLETYGMLMEAQVPGASRLLADMAARGGEFAGGMWGMEYMRYTAGIENVRAIEQRVDQPGGGRGREYDVVLRDGTHVELKNWDTWYPDTLVEQYEADLHILTGSFSNPEGLLRMRYVFRQPPPRSVENIRVFLRERLENVLTRENAAPAVREAMLRVFDRHAELVQSPPMQQSGGLPLPPVQPPGPALPFPGDGGGDEDELPGAPR